MIKKIQPIGLILLLNIISSNIISMQASDVTQGKRKLNDVTEQRNQNTNNADKKKIKFEDNIIEEGQDYNILDMPYELFLMFCEQLIKSHIDNWNNVFIFDKEFNKKEFKKDIDNLRLIFKKFKIDRCSSDIENITKRLKAKRFDDLMEQLVAQSKAQYGKLSQEELNSQLIEILDIDYAALMEVVKLVIVGADVNPKGRYDISALICAQVAECPGLVEFFINNGVDINEKDDEGDTVLMWAQRCDFKELIKFLINNGADINEKDAEGNTVLMWAAFNGYIDIVELLIVYGVDINIQDCDGETALDAAIIAGNNKISELLIKHGAK